MNEENEIFNKGDKVVDEGHYICVPCGYEKHYKAGDAFGECTSCLAGTEDGADEYTEGTGLWEKSTKSSD